MSGAKPTPFHTFPHTFAHFRRYAQIRFAQPPPPLRARNECGVPVGVAEGFAVHGLFYDTTVRPFDEHLSNDRTLLSPQNKGYPGVRLGVHRTVRYLFRLLRLFRSPLWFTEQNVPFAPVQSPVQSRAVARAVPFLFCFVSFSFVWLV